jgi:transcriptional regulator with XRE-family HTH domain
MAVNQNLKNALQDAGLSLEEFASILAVDPKSVSRWVAGTSTPYPRHRAAISRALALDETELWPDQAGSTVEVDGNPSTSLSAGTGMQFRVWGDSDDPSALDPVSFIEETSGPIDVLETGTWFELAGPVAAALIARAVAGDQVRVASTAPRPNLAHLIRQSGVQLRCVDVNDVAVIRCATTMLIASRLGGFADQPPALFHVEADGSDGLYDRLTALFDTIWDDPVETITTVEQLEDYRTNAYDDPDDDLGDDLGDDSDPSSTGQQSDAVEPPGDGAPPARRWPGSRGHARPA